jgi:hypothetical protein
VYINSTFQVEGGARSMKSYPLPVSSSWTSSLEDVDLEWLPAALGAYGEYVTLEVVWACSAVVTFYGIYQHVCGPTRI